jgi:plastocyanin
MRAHVKRLLIATFCATALLAAPAEAQTRTYSFTSRAFPMDGFQTRIPKVAIPAPGRDGYITAMRAYLVYDDGRQVSIKDVMLHHIVFINHGRHPRDHRGSCEGRWGEPFYGTGEEHQRLILPDGFGYRIEKGDRWRMQAMLMSHEIEAKRVRVRYRVRIVTGAAARGMRHVKPIWIRANGCESENPSYTIEGGGPPGSESQRTFTWHVPITGRLVAAGGHLHGGGTDLRLSEPGCLDRTLVDSRPLYGARSSLAYNIRPVLHEPGPISTKYFLSHTGIWVRRGQVLKLTGSYDGRYPRARVMAIMHLYIEPTGDSPKPPACAPLPTDRQSFWLRKGATTKPPYEPVPLNVLGSDGHVRAMDELPGPTRIFDGDASVDLRRSRFTPTRVSIPAGATLTWRFDDPIGHNVLFASGPRVVGSGTLKNGAVQTQRFSQPGTYKLFCYLHPVTMHQEVVVRAR